MEATKTTNETIIEGAKVSEKCLNEISESMMNVYNKQLQFATGLYDNFINTFFGNVNGLNDRENFSDMFLNSDLAKWPGTSFTNTGVSSNPFLAAFDKIYKQTLEYNRNLLASINNTIKGNQVDRTKTNADYLKTFENQLEISKKIVVMLTETFNKQMDLSIEANKKLMDEINNQLNPLMKQNQKLWAEFLKTQQTSSNGENKNKDASPSDVKKTEAKQSDAKKKWDIPVVE